MLIGPFANRGGRTNHRIRPALRGQQDYLSTLQGCDFLVPHSTPETD